MEKEDLILPPNTIIQLCKWNWNAGKGQGEGERWWINLGVICMGVSGKAVKHIFCIYALMSSVLQFSFCGWLAVSSKIELSVLGHSRSFSK